MKRFKIIATTVTLLLAGLANAGDETSNPPNFLLLIGDDMGVETVGCYDVGSAPAKTPQIDQLCDNGMRFDNFWSQAVCSPTRATILTGQYGFRNGVGTPVNGTGGLDFIVPEKPAGSPTETGPGRRGGGGNRPEGRRGRDIVDNPNAKREGYTEPANARPSISIDAYTLPIALQADIALGYETAAFGKWHLSNEANGLLEHPGNAGFKHYSGNISSGIESYYAWSKVMDGEITAGQAGYATSAVVDDTINWINGRDENKPWLAWVAFNAPHSPFGAPPDNLLSDETAAALASLEITEDTPPFYRAMIEAMDTEIGRLLAAIDPAELANTYVIFIGDNGTPNEAVTPPYIHGRVKGSVYQGGINVPFVVAGPNIENGVVTQALANSVDLYTTILDLAGVGSNANLDQIKLDAVSLTPVLVDHSVQTRNFAYADVFGPQGGEIANRKAIRDDQYKLVLDLQNDTAEFYDLWLDPYETVDLLQETLDEEQDVRYTALVARLEEVLASE